ncbi:hypothetical protein BUMB_03040 [Candidatus Paraburkholderia calva]|nr:hypothetical protein BUMB_03040 [Candidatus Paraburkholderia calva]
MNGIFSILNTSGSPWGGTSAILSALNEQGKARLLRSTQLPTMNLKATLNQLVVFIDSGANSGRFIVSEALRLDFRSTRVLRLGLRPAFPHYGRTCAINRLRER